MTTRPRDFQRSRAYAAEEASGIIDGPTLGSVGACRQWAESVLALPGLRATYPDAPCRVLVTDGRGRRRALADYDPDPATGLRRIRLPRWARSRAMVAHEVAHLLIDCRKVPGHGAEWAGAYLLIVRLGMGDRSGDRLEESFWEHRVKVSNPEIGLDNRVSSVPIMSSQSRQGKEDGR